MRKTLAVAFVVMLTGTVRAQDEAQLVATYQKAAANAKWEWHGEEASLLFSVTKYILDYSTEIIQPRWNTSQRPVPAPPALTVRILDGGKLVDSFQANRSTVFARIRDGHVLYMARFLSGGTGCTIVAYDFKAHKQLWSTQLKSYSHQDHSAYRNAVTLDYDGQVLVIHGNETLLRYVEYMDPKTGKTLAHRQWDYPWDKKQR